MIEKTEKSLYSEIRKAVHNEWDPIGVSNFTNDLGEYDAYIPELCRFLSHNPSSQEIFDYLWVISFKNRRNYRYFYCSISFNWINF